MQKQIAKHVSGDQPYDLYEALEDLMEAGGVARDLIRAIQVGCVLVAQGDCIKAEKHMRKVADASNAKLEALDL